MHAVHSGLSIVANVKPGREALLKNILSAMNVAQVGSNTIDFARSPSTLAVSGIVIEQQDYGDERLPAILMLLTSYSGPRSIHVDELLEVGYCGLCDLFEHCVDFPGNGRTNPPLLKRFLLRHHRSSTFYSGMHLITKEDIEKEELLRKEIKAFVNKCQSKGMFKGMHADQIRQAIATHIKSHQEFQWALTSRKRLVVEMFMLKYKWFGFLLLSLITIAAVLWIPFLIVPMPQIAILIDACGVLSLIAGIRLMETRPSSTTPPVNHKKIAAIARSQLRPVLNELTAVGVVKQGLLRRLIFSSALVLVAARKGMDKIPTVATARWLSTNKAKRLVFISNYANTSDSYVRDFIDFKGSARGINLLFGHGRGFPKTILLVGKGAISDPEGFMHTLHENQRSTQLWYCPFQSMTVDNITRNRSIRNGLSGHMTRKQSCDWLKLIY